MSNKTNTGSAGDGRRGNHYRVKDKQSQQVIKQLRNRLNEHQKNRKNRRQRRVDRSHPSSCKVKVNYFTWMNLGIAIAFIAMCLIIGFIYAITASVYVEAFADLATDKTPVVVQLGSEAVRNWFLIGWPLSLIIGLVEGFINSYEASGFGLIGLGFYLVIQTLELIPTIIWESPALILHLIHRLDDQFNQATYKRGDTDFVRNLKVRHNEYYSNLIEGLNDLRLIAFAVDIAVCFLLVKFVQIGTDEAGNPVLGRFFEGVQQFDFGFHKFDPLASFKVFSSLFLLLILVKLGMKVFNGFSAFAKRKNNA